MSLKQILKNFLSRSINKYGYRLEKTGLDYLNPSVVVNEAKNNNLSLCEYLESTNKGGVGVRRDEIIKNIVDTIHLKKPNIVEIGAGTGMYLEKFISNFNPTKYEVYETNLNWVDYLKKTYISNECLKFCIADGRTLNQTKSDTVDLVAAHGVFVYLPIIQTINYLNEMYRSCKVGGFIVFDCFTNDNFKMDVINNWLNDEHEYTFPVVVSIQLIEEFANINKLKLVKKFDIKYHASNSTYFIFQKT